MRIAVSRQPGADREVSPLELLFDLVYVFAIGQLSHHLVAHVDLRTGAETVILALAVFYAWYMVAWGANWLDPDPLPVRGALVGLMFASLLMSVAIGDAFADRAWLFVTGYLLLQVGRCVFLIVALRGRPQGEHFVNDLIWELLNGRAVGGRRDRRRRRAAAALGTGGRGGVRRRVDPALAARPGPARRHRAHGDRGGASRRALPAVLHHRAGRDRADDGQRVRRRAVRAGAAARAGDQLRGNGCAVVVLLPAGRGARRPGGRDGRGRRRRRLVGHVDADADRARADRDRRRGRARDRPSRATTRRSASGSWRSAVRRCSCSRSCCSTVRRSAMPHAHARSASSRSRPSRSPPRSSR